MAQGKVSFDYEVCKGCGICVSVCPKQIIVYDEDVINHKGYTPATVKEEEKCIGCANCAIMCPDSAITVERI